MAIQLQLPWCGGTACRRLLLLAAVLSFTTSGTSSAFTVPNPRTNAKVKRARAAATTTATTKLYVSRVPTAGNIDGAAADDDDDDDAASSKEDRPLPSFLDTAASASSDADADADADASQSTTPQRQRRNSRSIRKFSIFRPGRGRAAAYALTVTIAATISSLFTARRTLGPMLSGPQTELISAPTDGGESPAAVVRMNPNAVPDAGLDAASSSASASAVDVTPDAAAAMAYVHPPVRRQQNQRRQQKLSSDPTEIRGGTTRTRTKAVATTGTGTDRVAATKTASSTANVDLLAFTPIRKKKISEEQAVAATSTSSSFLATTWRRGGGGVDRLTESSSSSLAATTAAADAVRSYGTRGAVVIGAVGGGYLLGGGGRGRATSAGGGLDQFQRIMGGGGSVEGGAKKKKKRKRIKLPTAGDADAANGKLERDETTRRRRNDYEGSNTGTDDDDGGAVIIDVPDFLSSAGESGSATERRFLDGDLKQRDEKERTLMEEVKALKGRLVEAEASFVEARDDLESRLKQSHLVEQSLRGDVQKLQKELQRSSQRSEEDKAVDYFTKAVSETDDDRLKIRPGLKPVKKEILVPPSPTSEEEEGTTILVEPKDIIAPTTTTYGRPFLPRDFEYDPLTKTALQAVREENVATDAELAVALRVAPEEKRVALRALRSAGTGDAATLTMMGYKGGEVTDQVNQDRAFIVSPYNVGGGTVASAGGGESDKRSTLLGVFDGHAQNGELVSEYAIQHMPKVLSSKLEDMTKIADEQGWSEEKRVGATRQALVDAFIDIHESAWTDLSLQSGGCTASVVLQLGDKVYIANAGDSQSLVATFSEKSGDIRVVYVTRADSPDLEDERARVERMGGQVRSMDGQARVLFVDEAGIPRGGLAVSRSIGDWELGKVGIIPDPIVDVIDLNDIVEDGGGEGVKVFAVSATDGLLDFVEHSDILMKVVEGLYVKDAPHLFTALEDLITQARISWYDECRDEYRDDITISASKLTR